jgi:two-component sensor histidine kinase
MASVRDKVIDAPRRRALNSIAIVAASVILLGLALAWGVGARISRSLRSLTEASDALGERAPVPVVRTPLTEVNEVGKALRDAERSLEDNEARLERALVAARMYPFEWDQRDESITRTASASVVLGEVAPDMKRGQRSQLRDHIHPLDQKRFARTIEALTPEAPEYSIEFRYIRPDGEVIWLQTSGVGEPSSLDGRLRITGFTRDITSRKEAEIRQSLLVRELHHRVKNNLATVLALANLSGRDAVSVEDYKTKLRARIQSMARSHSLLNENSFRSAFLRTLLLDELEPYAQGDRDRITIEGPDVNLPPEAALALGMAMHELATNAGKYGSLSCERGRLDVRWEALTEGEGEAERRRLRIVWRESEGPPVVRPQRKGFGSRLLESVIGEQLKGRVELRFEPDGLVAVIEASLDGSHAREAPSTIDA